MILTFSISSNLTSLNSSNYFSSSYLTSTSSTLRSPSSTLASSSWTLTTLTSFCCCCSSFSSSSLSLGMFRISRTSDVQLWHKWLFWIGSFHLVRIVVQLILNRSKQFIKLGLSVTIAIHVYDLLLLLLFAVSNLNVHQHFQCNIYLSLIKIKKSFHLEDVFLRVKYISQTFPGG